MWYRHKNKFRVAIALLGCASVLFAPPWLTFLCMVILALRYRAWEVILIGMCADFIYLPAGFVYPLPLFTLVALALVWALDPLRNEFLVGA